MKRHHPTQRRSGNVLALTLVMMVSFIALLAFAVDLGYLYIVNTELQRTADAAALSGAWELLERQIDQDVSPTDAVALSEAEASQYSGLNKVGGAGPALADSDLQIGQIGSYTDPTLAWGYGDPSRFNAVKVRVRRASDLNQEVPFFFARALGFSSIPMQSDATAAFINSFRGFRAPSDGSNLDVLPFALDIETWNGLLAGVGSDDWTWDLDDKVIRSGPDGVLEINLYPQGTGSPGNRGTVDIGPSNNSTSDLERQIRNGITPQDLSHVPGGKLELNDEGKMDLEGDTGISAGMKDALVDIRGKPRIIPIFSQVQNPGNNAVYTIVQFVGVRVMDVNFQGGSKTKKKVIVQPAAVLTRGGIPSTDEVTSHHVFSPVWLVR